MTIGASETLELIWIGWLISWVAASFWAGPIQKRIATLQTWAYRAPMIAGGALLIPWTARVLAEKRMWEVGHGGAYALAGVMLAGLSLTWWARIHLGRFWSSAITRKEEHRIVDTGPYALVRLPGSRPYGIWLVAWFACGFLGELTGLVIGCVVYRRHVQTI